MKVLAASMLAAAMNCAPASHPSDQAFEDQFLTHSADFNLLRTMSNEDSKVIRVAYDFTRLRDNWAWPRPESELGFSQERWEVYRELFRKTGADYGFQRGEDDSVLFDIYCRGSALGSDCKGIGYLPEEPPVQSLRESLDDDPGKLGYDHGLVYKRLKDHWYIYRWISG